MPPAAFAAGIRSSSTRSASNTCVECLYCPNSSNVIDESAMSNDADCCGRKAMPRGAMYRGNAFGSIASGTVVVQGGSFAFCNQPLLGSTTLGSSAYGWVAVHSVAEDVTGTMPVQS